MTKRVTAASLRKSLVALPTRMIRKRLALQPKRKGYQPGIRLAAESCGLSPTTYARLERGEMPDLATYLKVLEWLDD